MESTGVRGRVQVSQSTADHLNEHGKGYWLTPRSDKVVAKGKGEMDTYWLGINNLDRTTKSSSASADVEGFTI